MSGVSTTNFTLSRSDQFDYQRNDSINQKVHLEKIPNPRQIKHYLDEHIVGQESLKVTLAVALFNHYNRIQINKENILEMEKSNILLIGSSGSGKTLTVKSISSLLQVPFVMNDATSFTQAGYMGDGLVSERMLILFF
jgi:ATP-dependent Clp protease ATP-binding subunit ClpX